MPVPFGYNIGPGDPSWSADDFQNALEKGVATFAKANGITTQTQWDAFIVGLTQAQTIAVVKKILATVKCSVP